MSEPKEGEVLPPSGSSNDKEELGLGDGTSSNKPEAEKDYKTLFEKEAKARSDFETAFYKERGKNRELSDMLQDEPKRSKGEEDPLYEDEDTRVKALVNEELAKRQKEDREKSLQVAREKFFNDFPQYKPENDPNDYHYGRLKKFTKDVFLGDRVDEIYEKLVVIHNGLNPKSNIPDSKVEDSGVGDAVSKPKGSEKKPDTLTRPLNKFEQEAAKLFSGGEEEYRKKLAEKEKKAAS